MQLTTQEYRAQKVKTIFYSEAFFLHMHLDMLRKEEKTQLHFESCVLIGKHCIARYIAALYLGLLQMDKFVNEKFCDMIRV